MRKNSLNVSNWTLDLIKVVNLCNIFISTRLFWFLGDFWGFLENFLKIFGYIFEEFWRNLFLVRRIRNELLSIGDQQKMRVWGHYDRLTALDVRSDLRFEMYGPNYICYHDCLDCFGPFWNRWHREERRTFSPTWVVGFAATKKGNKTGLELECPLNTSPDPCRPAGPARDPGLHGGRDDPAGPDGDADLRLARRQPARRDRLVQERRRRRLLLHHVRQGGRQQGRQSHNCLVSGALILWIFLEANRRLVITLASAMPTWLRLNY